MTCCADRGRSWEVGGGAWRPARCDAAVTSPSFDLSPPLDLSHAVRILLKNQRNKGHEVFSHFAVDSLMDIVSLFSSPMNVITSTS